MTHNALWLNVYEKNLCAVILWRHRVLLLFPGSGGLLCAKEGWPRRRWLHSKTKSLIAADRAIKKRICGGGS